MPLNEPVAVWSADTNADAQLLKNVLTEAGIEAYITEDQAMSGLGVTSTGNDLPQVWVDRADAEKAVGLLTEMDRQLRERRAEEAASHAPIPVTCDRCGTVTTFDPELWGTVQECPNCQAFMDVGEVAEDWDVGEAEEGV